MKEKNNIPEVFSCIRKAFEYVKHEVLENDQYCMGCMLSIYAGGMQTKSQYKLLEFDFLADLEWENDEDETPVCIISIHIPFHLSQKDKDECSSLLEMLTVKKPEWLKNGDMEVEWHEAYQFKEGMVYPVKIFLRNASPEMASRFISFMASYFLPEGKDMEIWAGFLQEFDAGYEPVCAFYPDEGELITVSKEACS